MKAHRKLGSEKGKAILLSEMAHRQRMELIASAERSMYPEIRAALVQMAKDTPEEHRRERSRVSPNLIIVLATLVMIIAVASCWIAAVRYQWSVARVIIYMVSFALVLIFALYTLLSGHISQETFAKLVGLVFDPARRWLGFGSKTDSTKPLVEDTSPNRTSRES